MESNEHTWGGEWFFPIAGGLILAFHGARQLAHVIATAPTLHLASAYGAGQLIGELIAALCPLVIGLGLFIVAYPKVRRILSNASAT